MGMVWWPQIPPTILSGLVCWLMIGPPESVSQVDISSRYYVSMCGMGCMCALETSRYLSYEFVFDIYFLA